MSAAAIPGNSCRIPRWHRFLIAVAGPAMNILFAVGLLTCVYMVRYEYPAVLDEPAIIGWVAPDTPAAKAGIQIGDRIVRIDGIQNPTWEQVIPREALNPNQPLDVAIERGRPGPDQDHRARGLRSQPDGFRRLGAEGTEFPITDLEPDMPAEKAGMKLGDEIIDVDGKPIAGLAAMIESLKRTQASRSRSRSSAMASCSPSPCSRFCPTSEEINATAWASEAHP